MQALGIDFRRSFKLIFLVDDLGRKFLERVLLILGVFLTEKV